MYKNLLVVFITILCMAGLSSCEQRQMENSIEITEEPVTIILIRHAEKLSDQGPDPALSALGEKRAVNLTDKLSNITFNSIYSTNFIRTKSTVKPLAEKNNLEIKLYDLNNLEEFLKNVITENRGGNVIISGHSNTTPQFANLLLGKEYFAENFDEKDYDQLIVIVTDRFGKGTIVHLKQ